MGSRKFRGGESLDQAPPPPPPKPPAEPEENISSRIVRETNIDSGSSTSSGVVSLFYNKNFWIALLVVLLILSFLGVNFVMLFGQIVQPIVNVFWILVSQILSLFGYTTGTVINKTADVVSGTAKAGLDIAEGTVQSVGNLLIKGSSKDVDTNTQSKLAANILGSPAQAPSPVTAQPPTNSIQQSTTIQQVVPSTLDNVLNQSRQKPTKQPAPDASTSAIQSSTAWCFVGEMNGKRSCADVESSGLCLSGQVYKSRAECEGGGARTKSIEGFTGNGNLMMATPPPPTPTTTPTPNTVDLPGNIMQNVTATQMPPPPTSIPLQQQQQQQKVQAAPTGAVLQLPALGPPQYMGPPNFPPPGMTTVQVVGNPLLAVGPPNYIDFSSG
jgi:hypothetical protein